MKRLLLIFFVLVSGLMAANGSASLFVFFNGEPSPGVQVNIDNKITYETDAKGLVKVFLEAGTHSATILRDNQAVALFKFAVKDDENTQAIITLKDKGDAVVDVEEPGGAKRQSSAERMASMKDLPKARS